MVVLDGPRVSRRHARKRERASRRLLFRRTARPDVKDLGRAADIEQVLRKSASLEAPFLLPCATAALNSSQRRDRVTTH